MATTKSILSSFQEDLLNCHEEILTVIEHFNELQAIESIPALTRLDMEEEAVKCYLIQEKYARCLRSENEQAFQESMDSIISEIDSEMAFVFDFLGELHCLLRDYGEGPSFSTDHIFFTQQPSPINLFC